MKINWYQRLAVAGGMMAALTPMARADLAFNDFVGGSGPSGGQYDLADAITFGSSDGVVSGTITQGYSFTSLASGTLTQLDLGVGYDGNPPNQVTVSLYSSAGTAVGSLMESWNLTGQMDSSNWTDILNDTEIYGPGPILTVTNTNNSVALSAGETYWITATVGVDTNAFWNLSEAGAGTVAFSNGLETPACGAASSQNGGAFAYAPLFEGAFDAQVQAVPEPATLPVLGAGVLGLLGFRRRRTARTAR